MAGDKGFCAISVAHKVTMLMAAGVALSACVSAPSIGVTTRGEPVQFVSSLTYRLGADDADEALHPQLAAALGQRLKGLGLCERPDAGWRIEPLYVVRGENVGVAHAPDGEWIQAPRGPRFWRGDGEVRMLTLRWIAVKDGVEQYRTTASLKGRQKDEAAAIERLVDAILPTGNAESGAGDSCI